MGEDWTRQPWLWPMAAAARFNLAALDWLRPPPGPPASASPPLPWTTPNDVTLELPALRLRAFEGGAGPPVLLVAPLALHGPMILDIGPGHSLVERLQAEGAGRIFLLEWRSAAPATRNLGIDDCLSSLLLAVEELGGRAALIGICQGGWLAMAFAARFPGKVLRLVCAGAPLDTDAAPSALTAAARAGPSGALEAMIRGDGGLLRGRTLARAWRYAQAPPGASAIAEMLQVEDPPPALAARVAAWHARLLDLPGPFVTQMVEAVFRGNQLARGEFAALGRRLDLAEATAPLCLIAGEADPVAPPLQVLAAARLCGAPPGSGLSLTAPGRHLSLFMGRRSLEGPWRRAARWLRG